MDVMKFILWSCLSILGTLPSRSQTLQQPQRVLTTSNGLPQSYISGLIQDSSGFVWVGTRYGLARYDGARFKVFYHDNLDTGSLSSNVIISLARDRMQRIWVEDQSGDLDCFDPRSERAERVTRRRLFRSAPVHFVRRGWLIDALGNLWCIRRGSGLYRYDWKRGVVSHYTHSSQGLLSDTLRGLMEDSKGLIWVASQRGLSVFGQDGQLRRQVAFPFAPDFNDYENVTLNTDDMVGALHERADGEIMLGDRSRLIFFDPGRNLFRTVALPPGKSNGIRWIQTGPDGLEYCVVDGIVFKYGDVDGLTAIGEIGRPELRTMESFLVDRSGLIWLGTNAAGIYLIDVHMPFFDSHPTRWSFHQDVLLKALSIQLDRYFGWPSSDWQFRQSSYYTRSTYDARGRLWIGQRKRVGYYDDKRRTMVLLPDIPDLGNPSDYSLGIRGLSFSPDGRPWVVGDNGYIGYFDSATRRWTTVFSPGFIQRTFGPLAEPSDLVADRDTLWIATVGADLLYVALREHKIRQLGTGTAPGLFPTNLTVGLQRDPKRPNVLWVGTYEGLVCLDKNNLKTRVFTTRDKLPDNTMYSILASRGGYLWLGTNKGLCRFDPVTHEVQTYEREDGLQGDEFNRFHYLELPDGRLAFGGTDGWTIFDPLHIHIDNYQTPIAFSDLQINEAPIRPAAGTVLPVAINDLQTLRLPYDKNTLSFEIAGLEYNRPQKLIYRYQLVGYDDNWVQTGNTPVVSFTKLPPGHYTLRINAANITGQWSPDIRSLRVIIYPPLWETWWAFALYLLLAAVMVWRYWGYTIRRQQLHQEMRLKEREALQFKQLDELKSRFFSNIAHELRTPLTLILTPAQQLSGQLKQEEQRRRAAAIERNAHRLLRLIDQLLDLSKLESGSLKLHEAIGHLPQFLEEEVQSFRPEAEARGIELHLVHELDNELYWFDAEKLEQIVGNLLANALKFTPSGGRVELVLSPGYPEGVRLVVRDTGKGIPAEQLPYIFQRFYRVENHPSAPQGSGIGLSLVRELVEWQSGTVSVESPLSGPWKTVFTIDVPFRKAHSPQAPDVQEETYQTSILLVEDNRELAGFITDCLPSTYQVIYAANGEEGLDKTLTLLPDLIISDVLMPVMDGFTMCSRIKQDERVNHIPVILLTAKAGLDNRLIGLSGGADDYLTKPFNIQELQFRVANLLGRQERLREKLKLELSKPGTAPLEPPPIADASSNIFLQKIYQILDENLDEPSLSVEGLADRIGMSRANLHRKLKTLTGLTASDIIRNYRLKRAGQFLREGYNSSETAYKVGFSSPAYFSKCFREFYEVSPLEYAQQQ